MTFREFDNSTHENTATGESGASFLMGLLSGVAVGVGIGMLFAPRAGSEIRQGLARSAGDLQRAASESLNQASAKVRQAAESAKAKGSSAMSAAREQWNELRDEAEQAVTPPTSTTSSSPPYVS